MVALLVRDEGMRSEWSGCTNQGRLETWGRDEMCRLRRERTHVMIHVMWDDRFLIEEE